MDKRGRERIGPFVMTRAKDLGDAGIICAMCEKELSNYDPGTDTHTPPVKDLFAARNVPVPNFGWFCSHACADQYEQGYNVKFQRDNEGQVMYYPEMKEKKG